MNIRFQKFGEFLAFLKTCNLLQQHCAVWHCINRTVQTVRRQKAVPYWTDSSPFLLPDLPLCSFSQYSALHSALFLQSTFRCPFRSVPSVNIPLCSFSQHSAFQSVLFLQSTFPCPFRSLLSVNVPLSIPLCSFSQHSALQSALLRHIKLMTLSLSRSYKHRPSSLPQSHAVTSPAFYYEGLRSTPSRLM
jgi:hypothetical protein